MAHYRHYFWCLCFFFLILRPRHINSSIVLSSNNNKSCLHDQSLALLQFKASISIVEGYGSYSKLWSWNAHTDCCYWDGITCDGDNNGYVIGVDVSESGLEGPVDSSINSLFNLHHLRSLNLAYNQFNISSSSSIPPTLFKHSLLPLTHLNLSGFMSIQIHLEISQFEDLVSLDISSLDLVNVKTPTMLRTLIRSFRSLRELNMDSLSLTMGPAADWFRAISSANLHNLQVLTLSRCGFSGPIEYSSLSNLSSLSHLYLSYNNITHFPREIFHLPNLQVLDLSYNGFLTGSLTEFPKQSAIQQLIFSYTQFSGTIPHSIGNLKFLTKFIFNVCNLSGPVPDSFWNLGQLMFVDLSENNLKGKIPSSISKLSHLVQLDLSYNSFTGPLPSLKSSSKTITEVDLSSNNFTGPIPSSYANNNGLPNLQSLVLSANSLTGAIPSSLFILPSLEILGLGRNKFTGKLDGNDEYNFPSTSFSTRMLTIDLCDNMLEGRIPTLFSKLSSLEVLNLCSNNFHGVVDRHMFDSLRNLSYIDLSNNRLLSIETTDTMFAIPNLSSFYFSSCNLSEFPRFLKYQKQLEDLDLSNNQLQGKMPKWIWNKVSSLNLSHNYLIGFEEPSSIVQGSIPIPTVAFSYFSVANNRLIGDIPLTICNTSYDYIDLSNNQISGTIPSCFVNLSTRRKLDLSKNKLQGSIPHSFGDKCGMSRLNFNGNQLEGPLPRSLANCRGLQVLDLGHNQINDTFPFWLESLQELQVLMLESNRFHGRIGQHQLNNSSFPELHIINLSSNNFTGRLPLEYFRFSKLMTTDKEDDELGKVIYFRDEDYYKKSLMVPSKGQSLDYVTSLILILNVIDLSSNQFDGGIPELVGDFKNIVVLNLSHNNLMGKIPSSLGNLRELESLDLSNNDLFGEIPSELTSLTFLSVLNLSWNHLVGRIPSGGQFATFSSSSFEGNTGLCGSQLQIECKQQRDIAPSSEKHYSHENSNTNFDWIFALAGYVSGLVNGVVIEHFLLSRNMHYVGKIMKIERFIQDNKRFGRIPHRRRRN